MFLNFCITPSNITPTAFPIRSLSIQGRNAAIKSAAILSALIPHQRKTGWDGPNLFDWCQICNDLTHTSAASGHERPV
jgi:hypothetical protein